jgi:predicted dehydrogenase
MPRTTRRWFLKSIPLSTAGLWATATAPVRADDPKNPSDKLNLAVIGCGGRGAGHVAAARKHNLLALCDVDDVRAAKQFEENLAAKKYRDFRKMLDDLGSKLDAVLIATPDHTHAPAAVAAMKLGKHVYCEKPLAHSVHECRVMADTAVRMKVATQMGNQGHSNRTSRQLVEVIRSGVIGPIREAHGWTPKNFAAKARPSETPPVPATLDWDLWLGPAPARPFNPAYLPFNWRGWWDFGTGGLGDMACHILDPIFWALDLTHPATVEAEGSPKDNPEGFASDLTVKYEFATRGDAAYQKPVTVYWHHGGHVPQQRPIPGVALPPGLAWPREAAVFIGEKGIIIGDRGPGLIAILPAEKYAGFKPGELAVLPEPVGHHEEWLHAIKGGPPALSHFGYGARLTETVL